MGTMYIVGEGASFVSDGRSYKPGDEINGDLFSKAALEANLKGKKLLEKKTAADSPSGNVQKTLDEMNVEELKAFAKEKNITVSGNKAEILATIKAAVNPPSGDVQKSLDEMSLEELEAFAKEKNITVSGSREEMLAAIKSAVGANGEGGE